MKLDPRKEYEISKKRAYENVILSYWMRNFWDGRADGIEWCIKHLNDKVALQQEYENCLHVKETSARINVPELMEIMRYYEGRADGVQWCLENFDNLELPEGPGRKSNGGRK